MARDRQSVGRDRQRDDSAVIVYLCLAVWVGTVLFLFFAAGCPGALPLLP